MDLVLGSHCAVENWVTRQVRVLFYTIDMGPLSGIFYHRTSDSDPIYAE
jgi:hypothetical protein